MNRIYITPKYGHEDVSPGDILAFSRTRDYDEDETDSDVDFMEDSTVSAYNFDEEDNDDDDGDDEETITTDEKIDYIRSVLLSEDGMADCIKSVLLNEDDDEEDDDDYDDETIVDFEEETHEDIRIASVFMRVVSVTPPVKKLFRTEGCHVIVELPNKKQVELNDFNGRRIGIYKLGAEVEDYIRSVHGLSTMLSREARLESKEAGSTDSFGLELFDVKNDPSSFKQALNEELERRKTFASDNQKAQTNKQIEQVKKFFAEFLD